MSIFFQVFIRDKNQAIQQSGDRLDGNLKVARWPSYPMRNQHKSPIIVYVKTADKVPGFAIPPETAALPLSDDQINRITMTRQLYPAGLQDVDS